MSKTKHSENSLKESESLADHMHRDCEAAMTDGKANNIANIPAFSRGYARALANYEDGVRAIETELTRVQAERRELGKEMEEQWSYEVVCSCPMAVGWGYGENPHSLKTTKEKLEAHLRASASFHSTPAYKGKYPPCDARIVKQIRRTFWSEEQVSLEVVNGKPKRKEAGAQHRHDKKRHGKAQ